AFYGTPCSVPTGALCSQRPRLSRRRPRGGTRMKTYCGIMAAALAAGSAAAEIVTIDFEDYAPYVGFELSFVQDGVFVTGNSEFRDVDGDIGRGGLVPGAFWSMALYGD